MIKELIANRHGYKHWINLQCCIRKPEDIENIYDEVLNEYVLEINKIAVLKEKNRVLCKEDILSLGWRIEDGFYGSYTYPTGYVLVHTTQTVLIEKLKGGKIPRLFYGVIRNKSELKTLMNQLQIS